MDLKNEVYKALRGSRKLIITFNPKHTDEVKYLLGMAKFGIIKINDDETAILTEVIQTKTWGNDSNRTLTIELPQIFDIEWFLGRMGVALENARTI